MLSVLSIWIKESSFQVFSISLFIASILIFSRSSFNNNWMICAKHDRCPLCVLKLPEDKACWSSQVNVLLLNALSVVIANIWFAISYLWRMVLRTHARLTPEWEPERGLNLSKTLRYHQFWSIKYPFIAIKASRFRLVQQSMVREIFALAGRSLRTCSSMNWTWS